MSGSDLCSTHNADSDRRPKQSQTSEDYNEEGIEARICLDVDKAVHLQITRSHGKWIMTQLPSFY